MIIKVLSQQGEIIPGTICSVHRVIPHGGLTDAARQFVVRIGGKDVYIPDLEGCVVVLDETAGSLPTIKKIRIVHSGDGFVEGEEYTVIDETDECYHIQTGINAKSLIHKSLAVAIEEKGPFVPEQLRKAADIYAERNAVYGGSYKHFGTAMVGVFPEGVNLTSVDDFNRFGILVQMVAKVTRYGQMFTRGGHKDSLDDLSVYSQMLQELDHEISTKESTK